MCLEKLIVKYFYKKMKANNKLKFNHPFKGSLSTKGLKTLKNLKINLFSGISETAKKLTEKMKKTLHKVLAKSNKQFLYFAYQIIDCIFPVSAKPLQSRMGKGKANIKEFVAVIKKATETFGANFSKLKGKLANSVSTQIKKQKTAYKLLKQFNYKQIERADKINLYSELASLSINKKTSQTFAEMLVFPAIYDWFDIIIADMIYYLVETIIDYCSPSQKSETKENTQELTQARANPLFHYYKANRSQFWPQSGYANISANIRASLEQEKEQAKTKINIVEDTQVNVVSPYFSTLIPESWVQPIVNIQIQDEKENKPVKTFFELLIFFFKCELQKSFYNIIKNVYSGHYIIIYSDKILNYWSITKTSLYYNPIKNISQIILLLLLPSSFIFFKIVLKHFAALKNYLWNVKPKLFDRTAIINNYITNIEQYWDKQTTVIEKNHISKFFILKKIISATLNLKKQEKILFLLNNYYNKNTSKNSFIIIINKTFNSLFKEKLNKVSLINKKENLKKQLFNNLIKNIEQTLKNGRNNDLNKKTIIIKNSKNQIRASVMLKTHNITTFKVIKKVFSYLSIMDNNIYRHIINNVNKNNNISIINERNIFYVFFQKNTQNFKQENYQNYNNNFIIKDMIKKSITTNINKQQFDNLIENKYNKFKKINNYINNTIFFYSYKEKILRITQNLYNYNKFIKTMSQKHIIELIINLNIIYDNIINIINRNKCDNVTDITYIKTVKNNEITTNLKVIYQQELLKRKIQHKIALVFPYKKNIDEKLYSHLAKMYYYTNKIKQQLIEYNVCKSPNIIMKYKSFIEANTIWKTAYLNKQSYWNVPHYPTRILNYYEYFSYFSEYCQMYFRETNEDFILNPLSQLDYFILDNGAKHLLINVSERFYNTMTQTEIKRFYKAWHNYRERSGLKPWNNESYKYWLFTSQTTRIGERIGQVQTYSYYTRFDPRDLAFGIESKYGLKLWFYNPVMHRYDEIIYPDEFLDILDDIGSIVDEDEAVFTFARNDQELEHEWDIELNEAGPPKEYFQNANPHEEYTSELLEMDVENFEYIEEQGLMMTQEPTIQAKNLRSIDPVEEKYFHINTALDRAWNMVDIRPYRHKVHQAIIPTSFTKYEAKQKAYEMKGERYRKYIKGTAPRLIVKKNKKFKIKQENLKDFIVIKPTKIAHQNINFDVKFIEENIEDYEKDFELLPERMEVKQAISDKYGQIIGVKSYNPLTKTTTYFDKNNKFILRMKYDSDTKEFLILNENFGVIDKKKFKK